MAGFSTNLEFLTLNVAKEALAQIAEAQGFTLTPREGPFAVNHELQGVASFGCSNATSASCQFYVVLAKAREPVEEWHVYTLQNDHSETCPAYTPPISAIRSSDSDEQGGSESDAESDKSEDVYYNPQQGRYMYTNGYHDSSSVELSETELRPTDPSQPGFYHEERLSYEDSKSYDDDEEVPRAPRPYVRSPSLPMPAPRKSHKSAPAVESQASKGAFSEPQSQASIADDHSSENEIFGPSEYSATHPALTSEERILDADPLDRFMEAFGLSENDLRCDIDSLDMSEIMSAIDGPLPGQTIPSTPPALMGSLFQTDDTAVSEPDLGTLDLVSDSPSRISFPLTPEGPLDLSHSVDPSEIFGTSHALRIVEIPNAAEDTFQDERGNVPPKGVNSPVSTMLGGQEDGLTGADQSTWTDAETAWLEELIRLQNEADSSASDDSCVSAYYKNELNSSAIRQNPRSEAGNHAASRPRGNGPSTSGPSDALPFDIYQIFPSYQAAEEGILSSSAAQGLDLRVRWRPNIPTLNKFKGACFECIQSQCQYHIKLSDDQQGNWRVISVENYHHPACQAKRYMKLSSRGRAELTSQDFIPKDLLRKLKEKRRKAVSGSKPFSNRNASFSQVRVRPEEPSSMSLQSDDEDTERGRWRVRYLSRSSGSSSSPPVSVVATSQTFLKTVRANSRGFSPFSDSDSEDIRHSPSPFDGDDDPSATTPSSPGLHNSHADIIENVQVQYSNSNTITHPQAYARKKIPEAILPKTITNGRAGSSKEAHRGRRGSSQRKALDLATASCTKISKFPHQSTSKNHRKAEKAGTSKTSKTSSDTKAFSSPGTRDIVGPDGRHVIDILDTSEEEELAGKQAPKPSSFKAKSSTQSRKKAAKLSTSSKTQTPVRKFPQYDPQLVGIYNGQTSAHSSPSKHANGYTRSHLEKSSQPSPQKRQKVAESPCTKDTGRDDVVTVVNRWQTLKAAGFRHDQCRILAKGGFWLVEHLSRLGLPVTAVDVARFRETFNADGTLVKGDAGRLDKLDKAKLRDRVKDIILGIRTRNAIMFECDGGMEDSDGEPASEDDSVNESANVDNQAPSQLAIKRNSHIESHSNSHQLADGQVLEDGGNGSDSDSSYCVMVSVVPSYTATNGRRLKD